MNKYLIAMYTHYFITALRQLWKYKLQNLIGITGLAIGLFCFSVCLYCFRLVNGMDRHYTNYPRLAEIVVQKPADEEKGEKGWSTLFSSVDLAEMLRNSSLSHATGFYTVSDPRTRSYQVETHPGKTLPFDIHTMEIDTLYNEFFTPEWIEGSWDRIKLLPNALILSESTARWLFGEGINPVGKTLTLMHRLQSSPESTPETGGILYMVQGVVRDLPIHVSVSFLRRIDMWVVNDSEGWMQADYLRRNAIGNSRTYALLTEANSAMDLQKEINRRKITFKDLGSREYNLLVFPLGHTEKETSSFRYLCVLSLGIGILVLTVDMLNFFYFLIGSFQNRMREYALRKVMGSTGLHLFYMLWVQILCLLLGIGIVWGVLLELFSSYLYIPLGNLGLMVDMRELYPQALGYWGLLIGICTILCFWMVLLFSFRLRRQSLALHVRKKRAHFFRNALMGIQFLISWIFVACTLGLFLQMRVTDSVLFGTLTPPEKQAIFNLRLDYSFLSYEEKESIIDRLRGFSGVELVTCTTDDLVNNSGMTHVRELNEQNPGTNWREVFIYHVDSCFFRLMNIPIIAGHAMGPGEIVVNESFAEKEGEVLGRFYDRYVVVNKVTGIARNFISTLDPWGGEIGEAAIFENREGPQYLSHCYILSSPGRETEVRNFIYQEMRTRLPENTDVRLTTLAEDIYQKFYTENRMKSIIFLLAAISLILTLFGVYSSVILDTARRQKEIAIRKINGASVYSIVLLFIRLYLFLLVFTFIIAIPCVTYLFGEWRQMYKIFFSYGFSFWAGMFLFVSGITFFTVFYKIKAIARRNPSETLRSE